jgi:hypothetical protein
MGDGSDPESAPDGEGTSKDAGRKKRRKHVRGLPWTSLIFCLKKPVFWGEKAWFLAKKACF